MFCLRPAESPGNNSAIPLKTTQNNKGTAWIFWINFRFYVQELQQQQQQQQQQEQQEQQKEQKQQEEQEQQQKLGSCFSTWRGTYHCAS